ncbi:MAG: helix-turn-helix domain-containing protein [Chloroflexota bacterium]|jgi:excisionase family DNA binding protein|nr:helix-turn-helix domain-containing protein [Chloroflexota bacterium]
MITKDWYTTEEAARELGLAPSTIRGAAKRGALQVHVVAPRVRAITREELDRYRREHLGKAGWATRRSRQALAEQPEQPDRTDISEQSA